MNKKMIRFIFLNLFIICCFCNKAKANPIDSLKQLIGKSAPDSIRVDLLNALTKNLFNDNTDTALVVAESSRKLADQVNYLPGLALALKNIGIGHYKKGEYKDAVIWWQQALNVYTQIGDKKGVANMLSNQGAVYFNVGDNAVALDLHLKSLKLSEEIDDSLRILTSYTNIGGVYSKKQATYKEAVDYFKKAYKLSLIIKDDYSIGTSSGNLGEIYYKMGDDSTALVYLKECTKAYDGTADLPYALNLIGKVYTRQKNYDAAINNHNKAYELSKKFDTRLDMTQALIGLAQAYYAKGEIVSAIKTYKESVDEAMSMSAMDEKKDAYEGLAMAYAGLSDYYSAYQYQQLLLDVKDSIYNIETDKKLGTLQFGFDMEKKQDEIKLLNKDKELQERNLQRQKLVRNVFIGGFGIVLLFAAVFFKQRNRISKEKKRSDELLLNILPEETAEELKQTGSAKAKSFDMVSVLFTDFKNFTQASEKLTPEELVAEINHCYSEFDRIISKYGIEKIKTIGDSYMCASGLPVTNVTHPEDVVRAGLDMVAFIEKNKQERIAKDQPYFELRLGIHSGPVVAGIVGIKKFAYDIWGDTVNTASRMESSGQIGRVNISGSTYELIKDKFTCTYRGKVEAKNKGVIDMYFVDGPIA